MTKKYIGDGVFVEVENGMLKLTTHPEGGCENRIYLEKPVFRELQKYAHAVEIEAFVQNRKGTLNDEPI